MENEVYEEMFLSVASADNILHVLHRLMAWARAVGLSFPCFAISVRTFETQVVLAIW